MPQGAGYGSHFGGDYSGRTGGSFRSGNTNGGVGDSGAHGAVTGHQAAISQASMGAFPGATTSYGAPIHTATGPVYGGISAAKSPAAWSALNDQVDTYNKAAREYNARTPTDRVLNAFAPFGLTSVPPSFDRPSTYTGGTFHTGINPVGALAGIAGMAAPVPLAGTLLGLGAGAAYSAAGGNDAVLTGPPVPDSWKINMPHVPDKPAPSPALGNPTNGGGGMSAFPSTPGGASFGAQPTATPTPQTSGDQMSAFFSPKIPNHSLPQGYQSMFPNSLSDADKALLYAQYLQGGA